ncbi:MAG TPA: septum formation inhibitor Maf [Cryomorphaceae bacterium]|nr:septum formation inhibitor Maf [Cryomorphaceae bacterium]
MEPAFESELVGLACPIQLNGQLVLGSGSPRRKELLSLFGLPFEVRTADTAEIAPAGLTDEETVGFVAKEKAEALVPTLQPGEILLTADTEVWMDGERFGKPRDLAHALSMLQRLRGRTHKVITVVWATDGQRWETSANTTLVTMADLPDTWLQWYVDTCQPLDKAGGYGAQEWIGHVAITKMEGDFDNVKGLSLVSVLRVLRPWLR